ncbi:8-oxo-dGTP diphosphatase [Candidatus Kaiserbacteria bacterium]|nr:8-oxo-dGTP diphosphatase [Candidatus Kaiserbacteria bacterium]
MYDSKARRILLALKKRGFGEGKWNGIGGRVEEGETVEDAAVREAQEEARVEVSPDTLVRRGSIRFSFENRPELDRDVHIFFTEEWKGEPIETGEMRPRWHDAARLPYEEMWIADKDWLPKMLAGKVIAGRVRLSGSGDRILDMEIKDSV